MREQLERLQDDVRTKMDTAKLVYQQTSDYGKLSEYTAFSYILSQIELILSEQV